MILPLKQPIPQHCPWAQPREYSRKAIQTCFPIVYPKTIISSDIKVDIFSSVSVKKIIWALFLAEIPARLRISYWTSLTKSCLYLKPHNSLQWTAWSVKTVKQILQQTKQDSSVKNKGFQLLYIVLYLSFGSFWSINSFIIQKGEKQYSIISLLILYLLNYYYIKQLKKVTKPSLYG